MRSKKWLSKNLRTFARPLCSFNMGCILTDDECSTLTCRQEAASLRAFAAGMPSSRMKTEMLGIASDWDHMADKLLGVPKQGIPLWRSLPITNKLSPPARLLEKGK